MSSMTHESLATRSKGPDLVRVIYSEVVVYGNLSDCSADQPARKYGFFQFLDRGDMSACLLAIISGEAYE